MLKMLALIIHNFCTKHKNKLNNFSSPKTLEKKCKNEDGCKI